MTIKAVLFDLDNTLLDFYTLKRQCIDAAVDAMISAGLTLPKAKAVERIYQIYYKDGLEDQQIFDKFLEQEFKQVDYRLLAAAIVAYRKTKSRISPYPGVSFTLAELLRRGVKLAIVSDAPRLAAWTRLTEAYLPDYFEHIVTFEDTGKRKPSPEPFQLALEKLGVSASDSLFVGDWFDKDIVGAKSLGMKTAYVMYTEDLARKPEAEWEGKVDYKLMSIKDLLSIVKNSV